MMPEVGKDRSLLLNRISISWFLVYSLMAGFVLTVLTYWYLTPGLIVFGNEQVFRGFPLPYWSHLGYGATAFMAIYFALDIIFWLLLTFAIAFGLKVLVGRRRRFGNPSY